jgi:hypothetical protein
MKEFTVGQTIYYTFVDISSVCGYRIREYEVLELWTNGLIYAKNTVIGTTDNLLCSWCHHTYKEACEYIKEEIHNKITSEYVKLQDVSRMIRESEDKYA